ncbi:hypothetical protein DM480_01405 [Sphingomonas sp. FARSPH]|nr:hypothetical protein DM480_01405 [Sphingomonas sp. FARSPH]
MPAIGVAESSPSISHASASSSAGNTACRSSRICFAWSRCKVPESSIATRRDGESGRTIFANSAATLWGATCFSRISMNVSR